MQIRRVFNFSTLYPKRNYTIKTKQKQNKQTPNELATVHEMKIMQAHLTELN